MGRPKNKIFTEDDWKDANQIDRLYMNILEPDRWKLSMADEQKLELLRETWAIMGKKAAYASRLKLMQQHVDATEGQIAKYFREAQELFGDLLQVNIETELQAAYQRFMRLYEKAQTAGDFEAARRCQGDALKVLDLLELRKPKQQKQYPNIIFTSDPKALRPRNAEPEDIEFEDAPGLLEPETAPLPEHHQAL